MEITLVFNPPGQTPVNYGPVVKDGFTYRVHSREYPLTPEGEFDGEAGVAFDAKSADVSAWTKPNFALHKFEVYRKKNIRLGPNQRHISHTFADLLDSRPGVIPTERFKAVGGVFNRNGATASHDFGTSKSGGLPISRVLESSNQFSVEQDDQAPLTCVAIDQTVRPFVTAEPPP
ncbi:MAG: hypothetical protein ABI222_16215 [Opitutaceae bacterium]